MSISPPPVFTFFFLLLLYSLIPVVTSSSKHSSHSSSKSSKSSLLGVILISRHGTRAPNIVTTQLCPANSENLARYSTLDISLEGVTGRGMHQLYQLGEYTKSEYVDTHFLMPYYSNVDMYIRAVGEDRTLQSAIAWGQALYPAGYAPIGYRSDVPSPLPVYTLPDELDTLLENRKAGCHQRLKDDVAHYDHTIGEEQRQQYADLLAEIAELCQVNLSTAIIGSGDNFGDAVKDITDNWTFDFIEHFPALSGLTLDKLLRFRTYAVTQLIGRILGTNEQITYLNGDLPDSMLNSFKALIKQHKSEKDDQEEKKALKFIAYHGHREMMYALAAFFDIRYNITYPALPLGAIPPATSLFFELHYNQKAKEYEVKLIIWTPCDSDEQKGEPLITVGENQSSLFNISSWFNTTDSDNEPSKDTEVANSNTPHRKSSSSSSSLNHSPKECGARPIGISKCSNPAACTFKEFKSIIDDQISGTGDWQSLCEYDSDTGKEDYRDQDDDQKQVAGNGNDREVPAKGVGQTAAAKKKPNKKHLHSSSSSTGVHAHHHDKAHATHSKTHDFGSYILLTLLILTIVACGVYYWFFMRDLNEGGEYQRVPHV